MEFVDFSNVVFKDISNIYFYKLPGGNSLMLQFKLAKVIVDMY